MRFRIPQTVLLGTAWTVLLSCTHPSAPVIVDWDAWPFMPVSVDGPSVTITGEAGNSGIAGTTIAAVVRFTNAGDQPVRVEHGACAFGVRLYRAKTRAVVPAWDNRPADGSCILPLYSFSVGAHASVSREVGGVPASVLAGRVPPGRYDVYVTWKTKQPGPVQMAYAMAIEISAR